MRAALSTLVITLVLGFSIGCRSMPAKQQAVEGLQSVQTVLGAAQDFERSQYAAGNIKGLTAQVHRDISAGFSKAFSAQIEAGTVLKTWHPGDPLPVALTDISKYAVEVLTLVKAIPAEGGQAQLQAQVQDILDRTAAIVKQLQGAK